MKNINASFAVIMVAAMATAMILSVCAPSEVGHGGGTRVGEIGWQYDTFAQNLAVDVSPDYITTMDQISVTLTSKISDVWIKQASVYGVVYPKDGIQFPFSFPFMRINDTVFKCVIEPFPLNGYDIDFYVVAYDYYYEPLDSRSFTAFSFSVMGSGWRNETFDENVELEYSPMKVNATEEVLITLASRNNITIKGANLWVTYVTPEGKVEEGGWNFTKSNVNSTVMSQTIPGYPAGTNITFWVIAWDQYNTVLTSRMYNYSVMGIAEYTNFPFEYTGETGDRSQWQPDDNVMIPLAGMCALGIPLYVYLYAINTKRKKKATDMLVAKKSEEPETPEVKPDE